ncbi:MAG: beta-N-acetylhexosaminidase [Lachnospiraceae bacterium]|nr:beta-N-acetylhexosaminidase [Lachnospiraceae bacterium]MDD7628308.1 glycoside hydrolase family 3 N-terminal domain-containing protein [Lachnospiraceae bacterium]MDY4118411.1 glycoside hydrolase family 3 N-terminal domain-containing protein [Lachnospiraceae bacterium]
MANLDREEFDEEMDRREFRRKRRVRNQVIAYISAVIMLAVILAGAGLGIHKGITAWNDKKEAQELQAQMEEMSANQEDQVVVEAPVETEEPVVEEEKSQLDEIVDACIAEMPLEDKVAGLFIITPEALTGTDVAIKAGDTTKEKLSQYAVGGLIYAKQNIKSADQLKEMISGTQGFSKYPLFIGIDEEGGSVSRIAESGLADNVGTMGDIGTSGDPSKAKEAGSAIAAYLSEYGFNLDFAPVADVILEGNSIIGDRSFGSNAGDDAAMVSACVEGLQEGDVSACLKHFPGLGSTTEDTHEGMATSEKTKEDFETTDFLSFQGGIDAGADFVMVSHLSVPNITGDNTPSSLSDKMITDILRGELGFNGIVITDAMDMKAVTDYYTSDEAAVKALQAGADMILMPEDFEAAYQGVLDAVNNGTLSEERINESLQRIYRVKYSDKVED